MPKSSELRNGLLPPRLCLHHRQEHPERTALVQFALDLDRPMIAAHDSQNGRQSQAASREFGGEERIENASNRIFIHAAAGVAHFEPTVCTGPDVPQGEVASDDILVDRPVRVLTRTIPSCSPIASAPLTSRLKMSC